MVLWEGFHHDGRIPVTITVEYDDEIDLYVVEVKRGVDMDFKTFTPKHVPTEGLMHISDVEKAVKLANILEKKLRQSAYRRNE